MEVGGQNDEQKQYSQHHKQQNRRQQAMYRSACGIDSSEASDKKYDFDDEGGDRLHHTEKT